MVVLNYTQMYSINELVNTGKTLFHTKDLGLIWKIDRPATLHMRVMRYCERGILYPIQRGLYSLVPYNKLDPTDVAVALNHGYCYLTTETILEKNGVINRRVNGLTFASGHSKTVFWQENKFIFRQLKDVFLFQTPGIIKQGDIFSANLERAVADIIYFNPKFHFDTPNVVNWDRVSQIQKEVGYK